MAQSDLEREILRPLWKVHILHHASEGPIIGNWMLEELRAHGYNVSPGTLYPMLARLCRLGWLAAVERKPARARNRATHYKLTKSGHNALSEIQTRLSELQREVFAPRRKT